MRLAFIMDPIEEINIDRDSTFAIMLAAQKRGYEIWYADLENMWAEKNELYAKITQVRLERSKKYYEKIVTETKNLADFDAIFMRKDPPFNMEYIHATYLLSLIKERTHIINDPDSIRSANEKVFILNFPDLITDTIVTKNRDVIKDFLTKAGGQIVLKPLDKKGGEGIFIVKEGDKNTQALIDVSTEYGTISIMAQKYIPEATKGDKRIILIDGEPLGAFVRVPSEYDHRGNLCAGATSVKCEITPREIFICDTLKPVLKKMGLKFVGIDILGDYLSEINVTSPTGLQDVANMYGVNIEENILDLIITKNNL
ncbi:MAG: glutathione synthase [Candidatus Sericytochromatia bacterium]|nr:glutathione synthase [Candidatus Sericytochromatia bacterium]